MDSAVPEKVNLRGSKLCLSNGCSKVVLFGIFGKGATHCRDHSTDDMSDYSTKCGIRNCLNHATISCDSDDKRNRCGFHRAEINKCTVEQCNKDAHYGTIQKKNTHCNKHKSKEMINCLKFCAHDGCPLCASYRVKGGHRTRCKLHKLEGMESSGKLCLEENCTVKASYGLKGTPPIYCTTHKENGMVHIYNRVCEFEDCSITAAYGFMGKHGTRCKQHKEKDMYHTRIRKLDLDAINTILELSSHGRNITSDSDKPTVSSAKRAKVNE